MKNYEKHLRDILQNADSETVRKIAEVTPSADVRTKERIFNSIRTICHIQNAESFDTEAYPAIVESRFSDYKNFAAAAACLLVCGGVVGGLATLEKPLRTSEQTKQITMEQLTEAISTTTTAPVSNIKTAEKATQQMDFAQPKETVINPVPVVVPVVNAVPVAESLPAETDVNVEITALTAEITTVQTTAIPAHTDTKETVSADSMPSEQIPAENVLPAQNVETTAPLQTVAPETTISVETTAIVEGTQPAVNDSLGQFRVEREEGETGFNYRVYVDNPANPKGDFVKCRLSYIPDGFEQTTHNDSGDVVFDDYRKQNGGSFIFNQTTLNLHITAEEGRVSSWGSFFANDNNISYEITSLNGYPALEVVMNGGYDIYWTDGIAVYRVYGDDISKEEVLKIAESAVADYTAEKITKPQPIEPLETIKFAETFTLTNIDTDIMPDFVLKTYTDLELDYTTSIYQKLTPVMDENDPTTIETRYAPTWFPNASFTEEGHVNVVQTDTQNKADYYQNPYGSPQVHFSQRLKENYYDSNFWDMTSMYEQIPFDGHVMYLQNVTYDRSTQQYDIFWNDGDYVFQFFTYGLSKEDALKVAESVKPVE